MADTAIIGLMAQTSIHAGATAARGLIDLPIQREGHTAWPCVYGSGVKGAWRERAEEYAGEDVDRRAKILEVFGPEGDGAADHAGALAVGDAAILLLPVRSLTTHFKWVTAPAVLERYLAACKRLGIDAPFSLPPALGADEAWWNTDLEGDLFLEEFCLKAKHTDLSKVIEHVNTLISGGDTAKSALERQLVVVDNNRFRQFAEYATPVAAHVKLGKRKTVERGALWYEETLPPETLLYCQVQAFRSRADKGKLQSALDVLSFALDDVFKGRQYLRLGGNETLGMGWCELNWLKGN